MAFSVCVGCGLSINGGLLEFSTPTAWPHAGCSQNGNGGSLYCNDDGSLVGDPRPSTGYVDTVPADLPSPYDIEEIDGTELTAAYEDIATIEYTVTNPSECLSAVAMTTMILDFDLTIPAGGFVRLAAGDSSDGGFYDNEIFVFGNNGTAEINRMGYNAPIRLPTLRLDPGETITGSVTVRGRSTGTGPVVVDKLQYSIRGLVVATV